MNEQPNEDTTSSEESRKPQKKTQAQVMQEALGLSPQIIQEIEKKLFIARFFDYFSEETLDFIYKDKFLDQNMNETLNYLDGIAAGDNEEDKLLKKSFDTKGVLKIVADLKENAEKLAASKGITSSMDSRMKKLSLIITIPMFGVLMILMVLPLPQEILFFTFPLLCVFCMLPQFLRASVMKKWMNFKEQNKNEFYSEYREDVLVLKRYAGEILENIRSRLLEMKVPLQLIKFVLHSSDYENLNLINQKTVRGSNVMQYFFSFAYPPGMEPYPIPDILKQQGYTGRAPTEAIKTQKAEKNFIVLVDLEAKDGVIKKFVPALKSSEADKINDLLNNSEFEDSNVEFDEIIPNYSEELGIFCLCGELAKISSVQFCNWKDQLDFYLFESDKCDCGEKIYALSLIDDDDKVPDELKDIFK